MNNSGQVKIKIVLLGTQLHIYDIQRLQNYKSKLFSLNISSSVTHLPDTDMYHWQYSKKSLSNLFSHEVNTADITIGILEQPIEGNYFMRRIDNRRGVITLYEASDILDNANLDILHYLLSCIYQVVTLFYVFSGIISDNATSFSHDETRGCLFDMCGIKTDIVHFCKKATICSQCESMLTSKQLPLNFIKNIKKELSKIRQKPYYIILNFIKNRPILSLIIALISTVAINIFSSWLYSLFVN